MNTDMNVHSIDSRVLLEVDDVPPLDLPVLRLTLDVNDLVLGQFKRGHHRESDEDAEPGLALFLTLADSASRQGTQVQSVNA